MTKIQELQRVYAPHVLCIGAKPQPHLMVVLDESRRLYSLLVRKSTTPLRQRGAISTPAFAFAMCQFMNENGYTFKSREVVLYLDHSVTKEQILQHLEGWTRFCSQDSIRKNGSVTRSTASSTVYQLTHVPTGLRTYASRSELLGGVNIKRTLGANRISMISRITNTDYRAGLRLKEIMVGQSVDQWDIRIYDKDLEPGEAMEMVRELNLSVDINNCAILREKKKELVY